MDVRSTKPIGVGDKSTRRSRGYRLRGASATFECIQEISFFRESKNVNGL